MPGVDYKEIFEKAEVGIALNDPDAGTIGQVNERYATLMGYSRGELRDMRIEEISADDPSFDQTAAMARIELALEGERQQFDWLFERKDGTRFWGNVVLKRTTIGPQDRLMAFVHDISERKQYERELEAKNERLDRFTTIVSHDLRSPLSVATGRLQLAREEHDNEDLAAVARAHTRMEALIEDLLTLAREGETGDDLEAVVLADVAEGCWRNLEADAATLSVEEDAYVTITADRRRLRQLFENLLRNGVEHGGDDVTITVGRVPDGFYVADDGPGIPEGEREEVFSAGYSTSADGTGFGLPIAERMADAHDWTIAATESEAGGARFEITDVEFAE